LQLIEGHFILWQVDIKRLVKNTDAIVTAALTGGTVPRRSGSGGSTSVVVRDPAGDAFMKLYKLEETFPTVCLIDPRAGELVWHHVG
jgi:hypothetical protein